MASLVTSQDGFAAHWLRLIYIEAFRQLGLPLEIRIFPAARAAAEAAAGNVDGEMARSFEYQDTQPKLIRVPEALFLASTIAYAKRPDIELAPGWQSLRDTAYRVEYRFGYPIIERRLKEVVPEERLSGVRNADTGLHKLLLGRSDIYVDVEDVVEQQLTKPEFRDQGLRRVATLQRGPIHGYLHQRHALLVPRLAAIIKKMRDSGQIERYRQQALHQN